MCACGRHLSDLAMGALKPTHHSCVLQLDSVMVTRFPMCMQTRDAVQFRNDMGHFSGVRSFSAASVARYIEHAVMLMKVGLLGSVKPAPTNAHDVTGRGLLRCHARHAYVHM
jgi:hypothetical protein